MHNNEARPHQDAISTNKSNIHTYKRLADFFDSKHGLPLSRAEITVCLEWLRSACEGSFSHPPHPATHRDGSGGRGAEYSVKKARIVPGLLPLRAKSKGDHLPASAKVHQNSSGDGKAAAPPLLLKKTKANTIRKAKSILKILEEKDREESLQSFALDGEAAARGEEERKDIAGGEEMQIDKESNAIEGARQPDGQPSARTAVDAHTKQKEEASPKKHIEEPSSPLKRHSPRFSSPAKEKGGGQDDQHPIAPFPSKPSPYHHHQQQADEIESKRSDPIPSNSEKATAPNRPPTQSTQQLPSYKFDFAGLESKAAQISPKVADRLANKQSLPKYNFDL